jgi:hypothetical protein
MILVWPLFSLAGKSELPAQMMMNARTLDRSVGASLGFDA